MKENECSPRWGVLYLHSRRVNDFFHDQGNRKKLALWPDLVCQLMNFLPDDCLIVSGAFGERLSQIVQHVLKSTLESRGQNAGENVPEWRLQSGCEGLGQWHSQPLCEMPWVCHLGDGLPQSLLALWRRFAPQMVLDGRRSPLAQVAAQFLHLAFDGGINLVRDSLCLITGLVTNSFLFCWIFTTVRRKGSWQLITLATLSSFANSLASRQEQNKKQAIHWYYRTAVWFESLFALLQSRTIVKSRFVSFVINGDHPT